MYSDKAYYLWLSNGIHVFWNMATSGNVWSQEQVVALHNLKDYHFQQAHFIQNLIEKGPDALESNQESPVKPKLDSVQKIVKLSSNDSETVDPIQTLQQSLASFLPKEAIQPSEINWNEILGTDMETISYNISQIYEGVRRRNTISDYLHLGQLFEGLYYRFQHKKLQKNLDQNLTWKDWLKNNNLTYSTIAQYREMFTLLKHHKKFYLLNTSFDFIYKNRKRISILLSYPDMSLFWA